ncbi:hypothetical protein CKA32_003320 [Geitlerinema sp. FC II]|nr:hypothetical protein CKA32_003320 [Geitlerinema sp. FC II]
MQKTIARIVINYEISRKTVFRFIKNYEIMQKNSSARTNNLSQ